MLSISLTHNNVSWLCTDEKTSRHAEIQSLFKTVRALSRVLFAPRVCLSSSSSSSCDFDRKAIERKNQTMQLHGFGIVIHLSDEITKSLEGKVNTCTEPYKMLNFNSSKPYAMLLVALLHLSSQYFSFIISSFLYNLTANIRHYILAVKRKPITERKKD